MRARFSIRAGALASLLVLAAAAGQEAASEEPQTWAERLVPDGRTAYLADVSGNDCLTCHAAIGEEWRWSTHATAWQDEHYQAELKKVRRKKSCHGCHVPVPLSVAQGADRPPARAESRHLGVDCIACHVAADGETILGPLGTLTDAHPSERSDLFETDGDSALCIRCHATTIGPVIGVAKDFVDTEQADLGLSCVECHMPAVKRPIANTPEGETEQEYETRRGRSHRLQTPRDPKFLRRAFLLDAEVDGEKTRLTIENNCGHRVPGLLERSFTFHAKVLDAGGGVLAEGTTVIDNRSFLPVEQVVALELGAAGASLELVARHQAPGFEEPVVFLRRSFELNED